MVIATKAPDAPIAPPPGVVITQVGMPLPSSLRGDRTCVSPEGRQVLKRLMGPQPLRFLVRLAWTWLLIIAVIAAAAYFQTLWLSVLVVLFVGTRQNVLALLLHEQVHRLGFRSRRGDLFCNLTIAYPLLVTVDGYRRVHLAHHQHYFSEKDPDYVRKQGGEWTFPQRLRDLVRLLVLDATGIHSWQLLRSKNLASRPGERSRGDFPIWVRLLYYLVLGGLFAGTGTWDLVLLYWLLPLLTVMQAIVRWAAICEHKYNLVGPTIVESTPFIRLKWWEQLLLPDLNFHTYHIYHHWYPAIPWSKLPAVHRLFQKEGLVNEENIFRSYGAYLLYLLGRRRPQQADGGKQPSP